MSGLVNTCVRSRRLFLLSGCGTLILMAIASLPFAPTAVAQQRREREPNSVYAQRRAKLAAAADAPIVLTGLSGREEDSQAYVFAQEENFYYLTGHNEEGAGLILLPPADSKAKKDDFQGPREILFLPAKNPGKEKWNGVRMSPNDPGIQAHTGFADVRPFSEMRATIEKLARFYPAFYNRSSLREGTGRLPPRKRDG